MSVVQTRVFIYRDAEVPSSSVSAAEGKRQQTHTYMNAHTRWTSAAKEGFVPRLLESDISMLTVGFPWLFYVQKSKEGTLALARTRDKFTSQAGRLKHLPLLYPSLPVAA